MKNGPKEQQESFRNVFILASIRHFVIWTSVKFRYRIIFAFSYIHNLYAYGSHSKATTILYSVDCGAVVFNRVTFNMENHKPTTSYQNFRISILLK